MSRILKDNYHNKRNVQEVDGEGGFAKISFLARRAFNVSCAKVKQGRNRGENDAAENDH